MEQQPDEAKHQAQHAQVRVVHPAPVVAAAQQRHTAPTDDQAHVLCNVELDLLHCAEGGIVLLLLLLRCCCCGVGVGGTTTTTALAKGCLLLCHVQSGGVVW